MDVVFVVIPLGRVPSARLTIDKIFVFAGGLVASKLLDATRNWGPAGSNLKVSGECMNRLSANPVWETQQ
jgi:hypothetical protein